MSNTNHTPMTVLPIRKLHDFENHPYKVLDNEEMEQLAESIMQYGVLSPIIVRPKENTADEYEIPARTAAMPPQKRICSCSSCFSCRHLLTDFLICFILFRRKKCVTAIIFR